MREQTTSVLRVKVPGLVLWVRRNICRTVVGVVVCLGKDQRENRNRRVQEESGKHHRVIVLDSQGLSKGEEGHFSGVETANIPQEIEPAGGAFSVGSPQIVASHTRLKPPSSELHPIKPMTEANISRLSSAFQAANVLVL